MPKYEIGPMPAQLSLEVVALLERTETATVGHWRHWGFCDRAIHALLPGRRVAGTAVTLAVPGPDSTLLHHALGLLRPGDILVVDRLGDDRHACWGGGVTVAAKAAGAHEQVVAIETVADIDVLNVANDQPGSDRAVAAREELRKLQAALDRMPPRCREAIVLKKIEGLSAREIATRMGISVRTVDRHLSDGAVMLADFIHGLSGGDGGNQ